jgi:hypothetical protein
MKKIIALVYLIAAAIAVNAQITYDGRTNKFTLKAPTGYPELFVKPNNTSPENPQSTTGKIASAFLFEYGDGYFTSGIETVHAYSQPGGYNTVLTLSGRYDTLKPPQSFSSFVTVTNPVGTPTPNLLLPGETIRITPIATELNANEEMHFIITYKMPANAYSGTILFFYNEAAFNALESVDNTTVTSDNSTKRVRYNFMGQQWNTEFFNDLTKVKNKFPSLRLKGNDYKNILAFTVNVNDSLTERNIFLTLKTKNNITQLNSGYFEAVLINSQDLPGFGIQNSVAATYALEMLATADPHDPNFVEATPKCIVKGSGITPVKYHIHFQNEGNGAAHKLQIAIIADPVIIKQINSKPGSDFLIKVGNKPITVFEKRQDNDGIIFNIEFDNDRNRQIDTSLYSNKVPCWYSNPLTMGDIYFTINIPNTEVQDFTTSASIIFYNKDSQAMKPVLTKQSLVGVRDSCNENILPPFRPLPPPNPCCCNFLGLCWWWWILIVAGIGLLLWLILRRKNDNQ